MDKSPLQKLAPELRNRIYEAVFVSDKPLTITNERSKFGRHPPTAMQPAITQVCKQVRQESLRLFYNTNAFQILLQHPDNGANASRQEILNACRWLSAVRPDCHESVSLLRLHVEILPELDARDALNNARAELGNMSRLLHERGYKRPRLATTVQMGEAWGLDVNERCSLIIECFQDLALVRMKMYTDSPETC